MGTRGIIGWIVGDEIHGSYNHWDSYPTGLGKDFQQHIKQFMADNPAGELPSDEGIRWITDDDECPTEEELKLFREAGLVDTSVGGRDPKGVTWYQALRGMQGRIDLMVATKHGLEAGGFAKDSLFCEWGWLIDDQEVVIIRGFNEEEEKQAPYCKVDIANKVMDNAYWGCSEVWRGTPEEFINLDMEAFEKTVCEEEEDA